MGRHVTGPAQEQDVYAVIVKTPNVRPLFLVAALNNLGVVTGDVKNAYLYAKTKEKVFI